MGDQVLEAFLAHELIRDCLAKLARSEDRRDAAAITARCWPEARTDYGVFAGSFNARHRQKWPAGPRPQRPILAPATDQPAPALGLG